MKQWEAVVNALKKLGGEGDLRDITLLALNDKQTDWSNTKTPRASVRRIVRNTPKHIMPLENGRYALISHRNRVDELEQELMEARAVRPAKAFLDDMLAMIAKKYKFDKEAMKHYYELLIDMNETEAADEVDKLINRLIPRSINYNGTTIYNQGTLNGDNINPSYHS